MKENSPRKALAKRKCPEMEPETCQYKNTLNVLNWQGKDMERVSLSNAVRALQSQVRTGNLKKQTVYGHAMLNKPDPA